MKAVCWCGTQSLHVENVPDPKILDPRDAVLRITRSAICGSDLHLYDGYIPTMKRGDILGHEFMGEIVETGRAVSNLKVGDRVVVPFPIACGQCAMCRRDLFSLCENSNPNGWMAEKLWGHSPAGIFGYSHMLGGFAGGQAQYARVPFADVGPLKIPAGIPDEQVLFLSDIFPTGYMGADMCNIERGDVIAVWGAGPVGQFAIASAYLLGAERVIAIDRFPYRLQMARERARAWETINYEEESVLERLKELTGGRGPDACIDAVGMEAHGHPAMYAYDRTKQALMLETDRPLALREAITRHVRRVLAEARWNKKLAAQLLGIHRRTLYRLTKRYGIPLGETRLKPSATSVASTATRPLGSGDAGSPRGGGRDGPVTV